MVEPFIAIYVFGLVLSVIVGAALMAINHGFWDKESRRHSKLGAVILIASPVWPVMPVRGAAKGIAYAISIINEKGEK